MGTVTTPATDATGATESLPQPAPEESVEPADPADPAEPAAPADQRTRVRTTLLAGALFAALLGGGLAIAARHPAAVVSVLAVAQVLGIVAVFLGTRLSGRPGALVLSAAAAAGADFVFLHWTHDALGPLLPVLAVAVPALFAHQLVRGTRRVQLVESLSGSAALILAVAALSCWLQLNSEPAGAQLLRGSAAALGGALVAQALADALQVGPRLEQGIDATALGLLAGLVVGTAAGAPALRHGTGVGLVPALGVAVALALLAVLCQLACALALHGTRTGWVALPVLRIGAVFAAAAPIAYVLCMAVA
jgi:hypothetical protein